MAPFLQWFSNVRQAIRQKLNLRYEGAQYNPARSNLQAPLQPARLDITTWTRTALQKKARYWEKNSAYANRMGDLVEQYAVGTGLVIQPNSSSPEFNQVADAWWREWQRTPDIGSNHSFARLQGIIARSFFFDGEIFIVKVRDEDGSPKIQLFEADHVATPPDQIENRNLADGVALNDYGRPTAYWFGTPGDDSGSLEWNRIQAEQVIPVMEPGRVGQNRGLPFLYPVLNDLHDLEDLQLLEMQAAKSAAEKTEIISTPTGQLSPAQMRMARFGVAPASTSTCPTPDPAVYYNQVFGGRAKVISSQDKYEQFVGERPSGATRDYWRLLEEKVCIGVGIPFVVVAPDSMQGTVFRGALDFANAFFRARWSVLAEAFGEVYIYAMEAGRAKIPALRDPPADWRSYTVHPPRAVNVDVGRNSYAMRTELAAGIRSPQGVCAEQGDDYRLIYRQKAEAAAYADKLAAEFGIDVTRIVAESLPQAPAAEGDSTEPEPVATEG
jgi:lambda family phage portal protein